MEAGRQGSGRQTWAIALALAMIVSGCQSKGGVSEVLDPAAMAKPAGQNGAAGAGPAQATQSLGTGSTKVTMLLPLSASGTSGETGRKMRDAATLAMTDIGNGLLTLTIEDTKGDSAQAGKLAVQAITTGSKVVIGPTELPAAQHIATLSGSKRPA